MNVWTKCGEPRLYGKGETALIKKTWHNLVKSVDHINEVKVRWRMPGWHVSSIINVWTKYGELRFYDNGKTDLITVVAAIKAISMSHLQQFSTQARQKWYRYKSNAMIRLCKLLYGHIKSTWTPLLTILLNLQKWSVPFLLCIKIVINYLYKFKLVTKVLFH